MKFNTICILSGAHVLYQIDRNKVGKLKVRFELFRKKQREKIRQAEIAKIQKKLEKNRSKNKERDR